MDVNEGNGSKTPENVEDQDPTASVVSNMALAHELAMNEDFKLQQLPENSWVFLEHVLLTWKSLRGVCFS